MPRWDYECRHCTQPDGSPLAREVAYPSYKERDSSRVICQGCGRPMWQRQSAGAFVIVGFSARNGYSK